MKGSLKDLEILYIDDVIEAWYKLALDKKNYNKMYNLGSGTKTSLKVLFDLIAKTLLKRFY